MPLSFANPGIYKVKSINGGRTVSKRLTDMGLRIGSVLQVVSSNSFGPIIVQINSTRLALGKGIARKIIVEGAG